MRQMAVVCVQFHKTVKSETRFGYEALWTHNQVTIGLFFNVLGSMY